MPRRPPGCTVAAGSRAAAPDAARTTIPSASPPSRNARRAWRDRTRVGGLVACRRPSLEAGPAKCTMNVEQFCSASRVVIVAGKGGVGKTTVTAALATAAARAGASVLIVEVEGKSGLSTALGSAPLTHQAQPVAVRLLARTLTPDEALLEYLEERGLRRISRRLV